MTRRGRGTVSVVTTLDDTQHCRKAELLDRAERCREMASGASNRGQEHLHMAAHEFWLQAARETCTCGGCDETPAL